MRTRSAAVLLGGCALLASCNSPTPRSPGESTDPSARKTAGAPGKALFRDIAEEAGIRFQHDNGAAGKFYFLEINPGGCAFFDYDNDGRLDILLIQSGPSSPPDQVSDRPHCALYRNTGGGKFTDVTSGSGLDRDLGYAYGVAAADYDNDGFEDLFITAYGRNYLLRNAPARESSPRLDSPRRTFEDVTTEMGLDRPHSTGFATSSAFGDYNNDGRLDLYVCYYGPWRRETDVECKDSQGNRDYCTPEVYDPDTHRLFRNDGVRFTDVSAQAGITGAKGRGLAVAFLDHDGDGWQDIFVANDLTPNFLWRNDGKGGFTDVAVGAGCAYTEGGGLMAGMGVAIADFDHSGAESLFVTNFSLKPNALFRPAAKGLYTDAAQETGLALPSLKFLAFGCEFLDYDADGWADLFVGNGHVAIHAHTMAPGITYRERKQLFHNVGGRFEEIMKASELGDLAVETVARGVAVGDYDDDGRVDALVNNNGGAAQLFHNEDPSSRHWVRFRPIGTKSNRSGAHARFTVTAAGVRQTATARAGSSYLSHSDRRIYFGLGDARIINSVDIRWPSGARTELKELVADRTYTVTEGAGITKSE